MFEGLTEKLERSFKILKGQGYITEINVAETVKEVRKALLDADVSYKIAKDVTNDIKEKAKKIKSVTVSTFSPSICHEVMGQNVIFLVF